MTDRLVTRSGDGYVVITLLRDEPNALHSVVIFCDPYDTNVTEKKMADAK